MNALFRVGGSKFFMGVLTVNIAKNGFIKISLNLITKSQKIGTIAPQFICYTVTIGALVRCGARGSIAPLLF